MTISFTVTVLVLCVILIAYWVRRYLLEQIGGYIVGRMARPQPSVFVMRLRDLVFLDPVYFMGRIWSDDRQNFVKGIWKEAGWPIGSHKMLGGQFVDGVLVDRVNLPDGRAFAVITIPGPQRVHEPYLIGVVLPWDHTLHGDLARARRAVRFFVLDRWEGNRTTDLCEWTYEKKRLTYNIEPRGNAEGFAGVVGAKLVELGR